MYEGSDLLTEYELADLLRVKVHVVRRLRKRGEPPEFLMVGNHIRYPRSALARFLAGEQRKKEGSPTP
jgi:excisionase family DNA binding protein